MQSFGQDTGYVFKQAAAGDMRQRTDSPAMNKRQQRLHIESGGSHQGIDQQNILIEQSGTLQLQALVSGQAADQRKADGMNAGESEANKQSRKEERRIGEESISRCRHRRDRTQKKE